VLATLK